MGGGRNENSTAVGGRNMATSGVAGATSCIPNDWLYGRLDTDSSGNMTPESTQAPPQFFDRRRTGNATFVDGVGSPGRIEELDRRFEEERRGWERRVLDLEEEVRMFRCKGEEDEGRHGDGSRIDPRSDVLINRVEAFEEGVAPIDLY